MRPGTPVPDRHRLAGDLLDEVYEQEKEKVKTKVKGMNATLAIDGWSTLTNEPVLGVCFVCQGVTYLVTTIVAAHLLDHRSHGNDMCPSEIVEAVEYIKGFAGTEVMEDLTKYMGKVQPYNEDLFTEDYKNVAPDAWWKSGIKLGFSQLLVDFACSLVTAVASSAGLERYFSTLGLTYGKLRSSLGVEKAGKMAFLFKQLNKE